MGRALTHSRKTESISSLKAKVWKLVSEYVRRSNSDWRGNATCVTCGKVDHWKNMQSGHFIPGRRNSLIFDLRHIYVQCPKCNVFLHGNLIAYYPFMVNTVGQKVIDDLKKLNQQDKQFTRIELEQLKDDFTQKIATLDAKELMYALAASQ